MNILFSHKFIPILISVIMVLINLNCTEKSKNINIPKGGTEIIRFLSDDLSLSKLRTETNENFDLSVHKGNLQFTVKKTFSGWWKAMVKIYPEVVIEKDDVLLLVCTLKSDSLGTQNSRPEAFFLYSQSVNKPYTRLLGKYTPVTKKWQTFTFPFKAKITTQSKDSYLIFSCGAFPQTFTIKELRVINYKKTQKLRDLPRTRFTYEGREKNAPWRTNALSNIEKLRKGNLSISVIDKNSAPVKAVSVKVTMQKHLFPFGSAINSAFLNKNKGTADYNNYKKLFVQNFNMATFENGMKPNPWHRGSKAYVMPVMDFLEKNGIRIHGHTLIWAWDKPNGSIIPDDAKKLFDDPPALQKFILNSIKSRMDATKGRIEHWDVVNEQIERAKYYEILGIEKSFEWFKTARSLDSRAGLMFNDYDILNGKNTDKYIKLLDYYIENGVVLHAIGVQGHAVSPFSIPEMLKILDKFSKFNLPIIITEYDLIADDLELQADQLGDVLTAIFGHPLGGGFIQWGFWEGRHWRPQAALINKDWTEKPNYKRYRKLVYGDWWTNTQGQTDSKGLYKLRGFKGKYIIEVEADGKVVKKEIWINNESEKIEIVIE